MPNTLYPINSRYYQIDVAELTTESGDTIKYLKRRFVPAPERFATLYTHRVIQSERIDLIAYEYYADSEQYWKIVDANGVLHPDELTDEVGELIRIPLPEGIPSPTPGGGHD